VTRIVWTDEAAESLSAIHDYIARDSLRYAVSVCADIVDSVDRLKTYPESGRVVPELSDPTYRELIQGSYRIVYRVRPRELVEILTVFHGARLLRLELPG
jgi:plasmid stabilization system protein ParE